ncbi:MAG TPA: response regulator [Cyclobacteriaceae bacterium]|nr:response regulator [Cyclobacteriaceae bacterium]
MSNRFVVLLIDDDLDDQDVFLFVMSELFPEIDCALANDGLHALDVINSLPSVALKLILVDINMPKMNGIEFLVTIRKMKDLEKIPIYMYSTSAHDDLIHRCIEVGATGFIKKPSDISTLKNRIEEIISQLKLPYERL